MPILIQKAPHMVLMTVTRVSRARYPIKPAMNCDNPPQNATKGKKTNGLSGVPHQSAIQDATMKVEPEKPARPSAAGGAMGCKKMLTCGWSEMTLCTFSSSSLRRDMSALGVLIVRRKQKPNKTMLEDRFGGGHFPTLYKVAHMARTEQATMR